ncbi:hypothetical protein BpHYR1_051301 [Brachionus plicatilis]|uniref:Uncharacterized protein n=1 Tax=Brachionus plicatilis TaxID=10195 RepID=A0A3M7T1S2_BRAPC|nr:hypothetical protein BpHYR1_051301 [Brachionus plicatilis]
MVARRKHSQGSVERANADIKKIIAFQMRKKEWSKLDSANKLFKTVGYERPQTDFLGLPKYEDLNEPDDVFNPSEFKLNEIIPRKSSQENMNEIPPEKIEKKANSLFRAKLFA